MAVLKEEETNIGYFEKKLDYSLNLQELYFKCLRLGWLWLRT